MTTKLCQIFRELGSQTHQRIGAARVSGMRWSEESNTEHLLLTLSTQCPDQVTVRAFTKRREAEVGADWEWWFVGPRGAYGMRIQAKRIKLPSEVFSHLRYRPKGHVHDQMTSLIRAATVDNLTPAYCFYVASSAGPTSGCLIGHAQVIERARSSSLKSLHPYLHPWHRLVCPDNGGNDACETAAIAMRRTVEPLDSTDLDSADRAVAGTRLLLAQVREAPPSYVTKILDGAFTDQGGSEGNPDLSWNGLRGVVVFGSASQFSASI